MNREERLQYLAGELFEVSQEDKKNKTYRDELKDEFFRLLEYDYKGRSHVLPVKTIEVPDSFWVSTGMSKEDFIASRFPGWTVEHCEKTLPLNSTVFVLKRDPHFISGVVEIDLPDGSIKVSKEIAEYTPEIDWETLQRERPDLFERLASPRVVLDLNDEELERLAMENPEELATLERHMRVKIPALKVQPRRVKNAK